MSETKNNTNTYSSRISLMNNQKSLKNRNTNTKFENIHSGGVPSRMD